jgi:hypothetical protein
MMVTNCYGLYVDFIGYCMWSVYCIVNVMKSMNMILWCVERSFYVVVIVLCYSVFVFVFENQIRGDLKIGPKNQTDQ